MVGNDFRLWNFTNSTTMKDEAVVRAHQGLLTK